MPARSPHAPGRTGTATRSCRDRESNHDERCRARHRRRRCLPDAGSDDVAPAGAAGRRRGGDRVDVRPVRVRDGPRRRRRRRGGNAGDRIQVGAHLGAGRAGRPGRLPSHRTVRVGRSRRRGRGLAGVSLRRVEHGGRAGAAGRHAPRRHAVLPAAVRVGGRDARPPRDQPRVSQRRAPVPRRQRELVGREGGEGDRGVRRLGHRGRAEGRRMARRTAVAATRAASPPTRRARSAGPPRARTLMQTARDPAGRTALGTFAGCAHGWTPWGTFLTCEENFQDRFVNTGTRDALQVRDRIPAKSRAMWEARDERFDAAQASERTQPLRLGRRDRSVRARVDAGEAHGARALQPRKRDAVAGAGRAARGLHRRRQGLRVRLQVREPRPRRHRRPRAEPPHCSTTARSTPRSSTRTAPARGCRSCTARAASRRRTDSATRPRCS